MYVKMRFRTANITAGRMNAPTTHFVTDFFILLLLITFPFISCTTGTLFVIRVTAEICVNVFLRSLNTAIHLPYYLNAKMLDFQFSK
jgi:hypothetical protein